MHRRKETNRTGLTAWLLACCLLLLCSGCSSPQKKVSKSGFYFDTIITITFYGTEDSAPIDRCFALASEYEHKFSAARADSEISQINEHAGEFVEVSSDTLELIQAGIRYGELSGGKFDLTIGRLTELWNIPEIAKNTKNEDNKAAPSVLPDAGEIEEARSHVNYHNIVIDRNQVMLSDPGAAIDLGGIAKGYIADRMREYLREEGITSGIIDLGGNLLTLGEKPDHARYAIGIQKPFASRGELLGALKIKDASVVSSGIYERYFRVDNKLYHHILDVDTGYPVENDLTQVTIVSASSMDGDALSTACFALGLADGLALIESMDGMEAVFVTADGRLHFSSGFGDDLTFE